MSANRRSRLICHAYYAMYGMVGLGLLPPLTRSFETTFGLSHAQMGLLLGIGIVTGSVTALLSGMLYDHWGGRILMAGSLMLAGWSALGVGAADRMAWFVAALLLFHIVNSVGATLANPITSYLYGDERSRGMSLLHGCQGLGRLLAPLLVTAVLFVTGRWQPVFLVGAVLFAVWSLLFLFVFREPAWAATDDPSGVGIAGLVRGLRSLLRDPGVRLIVLAFVLSVGAETSTIIWFPNLLESEWGFTKQQALMTLTLMMLGYTLVRLTGGFLPRGAERILIPIGTGLHVAVMAWVMLIPSRGVVPVAAFLMGTALGVYWPNLAAAAYHYTPYRHGTLVGLFLVTGCAGGFLLLSVTGRLADLFTLRRAIWTAPVCSLLLGAVFVGFRRVEGRDGTADARR